MGGPPSCQPGDLTIPDTHPLYGNPCLKLLRNEVEDLVSAKYGGDYLQTKNAQTALSKVGTEIRSLQRKIAQLEKRKEELLGMLNA